MNELHMTMDQMIEEIKFMREFELFLMEQIPEDYDFLASAFARKKSTEALVKAGIPEEEATKLIDNVERDLGIRKEKM